MAPRQTLEKLRSRIEEAAVRRGFAPACVVVEAPQAMDEAAVLAKHFELYPRDRQAKQIITLRIFGPLPDPDASCGEHRSAKAGAAWRMLAREERERGSWAIIGA
jgi:hypothetical protein